MKRVAWIMVGGVFFLILGSGCVTRTPPEEFFLLSPESLKYRAMQSRIFETRNDRELLSASAAVLQDLGFQVEESVKEVGFLRAAKERSAREYGQDVGRFFVLLLSLGQARIPVDLHQKITASLVVRPHNNDSSRQEVRITFYRVVWQGEGHNRDTYIPPGNQKMEMLQEPVLYQEFFFKLSKAVFLEAYTI